MRLSGRFFGTFGCAKLSSAVMRRNTLVFVALAALPLSFGCATAAEVTADDLARGTDGGVDAASKPSSTPGKGGGATAPTSSGGGASSAPSGGTDAGARSPAPPSDAASVPPADPPDTGTGATPTPGGGGGTTGNLCDPSNQNYLLEYMLLTSMGGAATACSDGSECAAAECCFNPLAPSPGGMCLPK